MNGNADYVMRDGDDGDDGDDGGGAGGDDDDDDDDDALIILKHSEEDGELKIPSTK